MSQPRQLAGADRSCPPSRPHPPQNRRQRRWSIYRAGCGVANWRSECTGAWHSPSPPALCFGCWSGPALACSS